MQKLNLSKRMMAVAGLVPAGVTACDIGCDHGFVAIYLVREGICPKVIAMDVGEGPLRRAKEHIESAALSEYIDTRLSDGMEKLEIGEAECMIAAGMGGRLVVKIMQDYPEKLRSLRYLVLQPQSEISLVRRFLRENGFVIRKEDMVLEDGKFYPIILSVLKSTDRAEAYGDGDFCRGDNEVSGESSPKSVQIRGNSTLSSKSTGLKNTETEEMLYRESLEDEFGPCLIRDKHPVLAQYLDWWEKQQNKILNAVLTYPDRRKQVEEELARIQDVRGLMGIV